MTTALTAPAPTPNTKEVPDMSTATIDNPTTTATDPHRADAPILEIPLTLAVQSAAAMLTSAHKDDATVPALNGAYFDGAEMLASDRYKVARFPLPTRPESADDRLTLGEPFLIPRAALEWVAKLTCKGLRFSVSLATMTDSGYTVRYEREGEADKEGTVTVSVVDMNGKTERSQAFDGIQGHFPPVKRLFPEPGTEPVEVGTQAFSPAFMGVILAYIGKYSDRGAPFKITLRATGGNKMPPALIEGAGASFLVQPNLILR